MLKKISIVLSASLLFLVVAAQAQQVDFGTPVKPDGAITYDELLKQVDGKESLESKVIATVGEVCQSKGCWMTLLSDDPSTPAMRVTFKDYAFFMPKDLSGKKVVVEGLAYIDVTSVEVLRHYAEDAGKSKEEIEKITEAKRELTFEAAGVKILN